MHIRKLRSKRPLPTVNAIVRLALLLVFACGGNVEGPQQTAVGSAGNTTTGGQTNGPGGANTAGGWVATGGFGYGGSSIETLDPSCAKVTCSPPNCPNGYVVGREPGACCDTCVATPGATYPNCEPVGCVLPATCPIGYRILYPDWSCCGTCVPDPNYCDASGDCIIASKDTGCCSCPSSISKRLYADDPCYTSPDAPRPVPASCTLQFVCDMKCGACASGIIPICQNNVCNTGVLLN